MPAAVESRHPPGMIAVISGDLDRFPQFRDSLFLVQMPEQCTYQTVRGNGFAMNRNIVIREFFKQQDPRPEWLWFMDNDHAFHPELLMWLLERDVDIVQPLVSTRKPPFNPYGYMWQPEVEQFRSLTWDEIPQRQLLEVDAVGSGGMLIRRRVLEKLADPWFEEGMTAKEHLGEDLWFCRKAQVAGFGIYLDANQRMGHLATHEVWPAETPQGERCINLDLGHGVAVGLPIGFGTKNLLEV